MLSSKTLATVMLTLSVAGAVVTCLLLVPPTAASAPASVAVEPPSRSLELLPPEPLETEPVSPEVPPTEDSPQSPAEPPVEPAASVTVPAVGFSAPTAETATVGGVVTPPDFDHIFRVTDVDATIYVTHSCRYEQCLGNTLFNLSTGDVFVKTGQNLFVDGQAFIVTEVRTVKKDELPYDGVWSTDGVAVITCFQNKDYTPSTHNLVVIAQPK